MTTGRYFLAAAIVLLLGAAAMPSGLAAYALASTGSSPYHVAAGVWAVFVLATAIGGPVILTVAGFVSLLIGHDD